MTESSRLQLLYEMNQRILDLRDISSLAGFVTRRVRELFDASGCALLVLDDSGEWLDFFIANQDETAPTAEQLRSLRVPSSEGIAGRVLARGEPVMLHDAQSDPERFRGIDEATGQKTETLLCAPVITRRRKIGVVEVVNAPRERITEENLRFLCALAEDIAVAYEIATWLESLERQAAAGRRALQMVSRTAVGGGLAWCVLVLAFGSIWGTWTESLARPAFWFGAVAIVAGLLIPRLERALNPRPIQHRSR